MRCGAHELALIACSYSCVGMARIGDGAAAAMTVSCARCAGRTCRGQSAAHKGLRPSSNYKCQRAKHLRYPRTSRARARAPAGRRGDARRSVRAACSPPGADGPDGGSDPRTAGRVACSLLLIAARTRARPATTYSARPSVLSALTRSSGARYIDL
jgi:hypothetical protein